MPQFPNLKTGAVMQYPAGRSTGYSTDTVEFLDGTGQRYRLFKSLVRRWKIRLDLLDDAELEAIAGLFTLVGGRAGMFTFTDPWDGIDYIGCSFESDELDLAWTAFGNGQTSLWIRQNGN